MNNGKYEEVLLKLGYKYLEHYYYSRKVCNDKFTLLIQLSDGNKGIMIFVARVNVNDNFLLQELEEFKHANACLIRDLELLKEVLNNE